MNSINIFQKNWAFTSSDSEKPIIKTGAFGPCYVVTFTTDRFAAMTHIDDNTNVDSIGVIFDKFLENSVDPKDVKVKILGGWKENLSSFAWGSKIVEKIENEGFKNVVKSNMYKKRAPTPSDYSRITLGEVKVTVFEHQGAFVDARNGKTYLLENPIQDLHEEQLRQNQRFVQKYQSNLEIELPLTQVF